jgi:GTP-binding protein Era
VSDFRSGFACFVGRPNAGKSTLTNAIVGQKVAITSSRPQTTRTVVRGIVHRPDAQLVLVDTPGLHRPRTLLGERLNDLVTTTWSEVDVVAVCFPADQKPGPGDRFLVNELAKVRRTAKVWGLYMAGSRLAFERNEIQLHQVLASRTDEQGRSGFPLRPTWLS